VIRSLQTTTLAELVEFSRRHERDQPEPLTPGPSGHGRAALAV
jgi:hypothetical protein